MMAEGGALQSLQDGSDAQLEFTCTPCEEGNKREEAIKYCPECLEYLCKGCTAHHGRQNATRFHKLLNLEDVNKHGSVFAVSTKCQYHPDRCVEMYCSSHDMIYCALCIATKHRSCSGLNKIEDYVESLNCGHKELNLLEFEMKNIHQSLLVTKEMKELNISSLELQSEEIETNIKEAEREAIDIIQTQKQRLITH